MPATKRSPFHQVLLMGAVCIVWFVALFRAAHDLWSACVVFTAAILLLILFAIQHSRQSTPLRLPLVGPLLVFLATVWLSTTHSVDINTSIQDAWGWTFCILLFYLLINTLSTAEEWNQFLYRAGTVIVPLALICLWQRVMGRPNTLILFGIPIWEYWHGHPDSWGRWEIMATLINSTVLSGFVLGWTILFYKDSLKRDTRAIVLLCCAAFILLLARSSWAFCSLAIGLLFVHAEATKRWATTHKRACLMIGILITAGAAILLTMKLGTFQGPYKGSSRLYYWATALKIFGQRPWLGIGLGSYATVYPFYQTPAFQSTFFVHNFPLQWLCETGVLGFGALSFLGLRAAKQIELKNPASIALLVIFVFSLLSINLDYFANKLMLILLLGAALRQRENDVVSVRPYVLWTFTLALCLLSVFWVRIFTGSQLAREGQQLEAQGNLVSAKTSYEGAIRVDALNADAHAGLARYWENEYARRPDPKSLETWRSEVMAAVRCRGSVRHIAEAEKAWSPH